DHPRIPADFLPRGRRAAAGAVAEPRHPRRPVHGVVRIARRGDDADGLFVAAGRDVGLLSQAGGQGMDVAYHLQGHVRVHGSAGRDVIPLWVADSDFRAPPCILEALQKRIEHGVLGYTSAPEELREAIVERLERLYRWRIELSWIVFLPGVVPGLHLAARKLL